MVLENDPIYNAFELITENGYIAMEERAFILLLAVIFFFAWISGYIIGNRDKNKTRHKKDYKLKITNKRYHKKCYENACFGNFEDLCRIPNKRDYELLCPFKIVERHKLPSKKVDHE